MTSNKNGKIKQSLTLSKSKRIFFNLSLIIIPIVLLILLELSLRLFNYGYDLSLFNKSTIHPGYYEINRNVGKRYFTKFEETNSTNDIFLINKPDTCFRIFVLGESTAAGFPYHFGTTFSRILNYRLQDTFPHKRIEVVNTGMSAVNSFTLADFMDEILQHKPDLILVYTGHNEYYGALGVGSVENGGNVRWLKKLNLKLVHFRIYQLMQRIIASTTNLFGSETNKNGTLMSRIAKDKSIVFNSKLFEKGLDQFRSNLSEIIEKTQKAGVPIILSEQVSNVKDLRPFKSIKTTELPAADDIYNQSVKAESKGNYDKARELYYRAKDLDVIRFRAPEALNTVITNLGKKYKVPVVPMRMYFEINSPHGLIGNNLILEHLHPNLNGYFLMADALFRTIRNEKLIALVWDSTLVKPKEYYRNNWGFTPLDSLMGNIQIIILKNEWPFKPENYVSNTLNYTPVTYEDSVVLNHILHKTGFEEEHVNMAEHYSKQGNNMAAFNEYYSLIKCYPHVNVLYYQALNYLYASNKYSQALDLMLTLPDRDTCCFAQFNIGNIYARLNMPEKAIPAYKLARTLSKPGDNVESILVGLYNAYKQTGNVENETQLLAQIQAIDPQFNVEVKKQFNQPTNLPTENTEVVKLIDKALMLGKQGNFDEALKALQKSIKMKETWRANQLIGNIMFRRKDMKALVYYERAYKQSPPNADILNNLFILYLMKKDIGKASKCLDELKRISTDNVKIKEFEKSLNRAMNNSR